MNNKVLIKVIGDNKFINYLVYHNINYSSLRKIKDYYILKVDINDSKKINRRYESIIIRYYGIKYITNSLKTNKYIYIGFIIGLIFLCLLKNTIFNIEINTDDNLLKNKIMNILNDNDIKLYKKKKSFNEIEIIKNKILNENKDIIQWIEISNIGCKYIINLTKKVINENEFRKSTNDIISSQDGVIKKIVVHNGTKMKEKNEYVKKGEVLISGSIFKNDKIVDEVSAKGNVYAEVWYLVKINIPFIYKEKTFSDKIINHYYINILGKDFTILGKYDKDNLEINKKIIIDKPYLGFKLYKETKKEIVYKETILDEKTAYEKGIEEATKKINENLLNDEYIISKKVLKKDINRSKMYLEVFYKVYKSIGVTSKINKKDELNDISNN